MRPFLCLLTSVLALQLVSADARACACCTNIGQRHVAVVKLDAAKREELESLRFAAAAQLYTGEASTEDVIGIATPASEYELHVTHEPGRWLFDLRDKAGRTGTLTLQLPATISLFEVDPRNDSRDGGTGPALYKEWTVTAPTAGSGILAAGVRGGARISLVVHGHGNSCTSAGDFTHWTLTVKGPKAAYTLIGELAR
jgi:hypothetical protein